MADLSLRLACADYARVMPLAAGQVKSEGTDLSLTLGRQGSWPMRAELLRRVLSDPELDGGECSMAGHLRRVEAGDRSFVALPVFVLRGFAARDLYVRRGGPVRTARDLHGKRIGIYSWVASGGIWYRHAQVDMGVALDSVEWWVGDIEGQGETSHVATLPPGVQAAAPGRFIAEMLAAGEIDAMWSPPRPKLYDPLRGPIVRLFPDFCPVETDYYRRTSLFPPMHLIVLRRAVWERNPWIARSLTEAFSRSDAAFDESQRGFPDAFPWMEAELEPTRALMGQSPYAHGLGGANRAAVQAFSDQALAAGIIGRRIEVDEYFEEFLGSGPISEALEF